MGFSAMISYTVLFLLFSLTSTLLSISLVLLTRALRQVKMPPQDADYEHLLNEKASLETQLAQEQNQAVQFRSQVETLEAALSSKTAELEAAQIQSASPQA